MSKRILPVLILISLVSSCGWMTDDEGVFRDRKYDYRRSQMYPPIEVPDELDSEALVDHYPIPPLGQYADRAFIRELPLPTPLDTRSNEIVKLQKLGEQQWILLQTPASQAWPRLKQFLSQNSYRSSVESNQSGFLEIQADDGFYRFKMESGFQRNTTELAVRYIKTGGTAFWPETSDDSEKETALLTSLAQFFADTSAKPAYSYAIQNVSIEQKMYVDVDADGKKSVIVKANQARAIASVKNGLEHAGFTIEDISFQDQSFQVMYTPSFPENWKPGFFSRLFRLKQPEYDKDAEFAGNQYRLSMSSVNNGYRISMFAVADDPAKEELNQLTLLLKRHIY